MPVHKFMEETGEKLEKHELCIAQLQKDVDELKKSDRDHVSSLTDLEKWRMQHQKNFDELKETIEKENKETRDFMERTMDRVLNYVGAHDTRKRQSAEVRWKVIGGWVTAGLTAGGFLTLILTKLF